MKDKAIHATHGISGCCDSGGIERKISLFLLSDCSYHVTIESKWPHEGEQRFSSLRLTPEGRALLAEILSRADEIEGFPLEAAKQ